MVIEHKNWMKTLNISKKFISIIILTALILPLIVQTPAYAAKLKGVITAENANYSTTEEVKNFFAQYGKFNNEKNINKLLEMYDDSYKSADKFDKTRLKELAQDSWKTYPNAKYEMKVLSLNSDYQNATVLVQESIHGESETKIDYLSGNGYIESNAITIYYLKKFYTGWKIVSDYIIDEKTALKYGVAKDIAMKIDAPPLASPSQEYSSIVRIDVPKEFVALVSINNEEIKFPAQKAEEVFRTVKNDGIQERILKANTHKNNENAVASIGIAKTNIKNRKVEVSIVGIAFLTSRINITLPTLPEIQNK